MQGKDGPLRSCRSFIASGPQAANLVCSLGEARNPPGQAPKASCYLCLADGCGSNALLYSVSGTPRFQMPCSATLFYRRRFNTVVLVSLRRRVHKEWLSEASNGQEHPWKLREEERERQESMRFSRKT
eukprot:5212890-Amphidinium_carterae.1